MYTTTMLRVAITLVFSFYAAIHSMPVDNCASLPCGTLVYELTKTMNNMEKNQFPTATRANYVNNVTLINCNLNIFKKELNASWHCESPNKRSQCQFYTLLECIPRSCKVLNTTCQDAKNKTKFPLIDKMKGFLQTVARELPNIENF